MKTSHSIWLTAWYGKSRWIYLLLPLSWLFRGVSWLRKWYVVNYVQQQLSVPVVVVGNISVGGTGKTPLIIALVEYLLQNGYKPGVVSRGYGGKAPHYPYLLDEATRADQSGDEPLVIFNATKCQVCVAPDRVAAAQQLIERGCTIILSDDGLQHYRLGRICEIAVVDGQRLFGNEHCLPAGPLREPVSRLKSVDMVVVNNPKSDINTKIQSYFAMQIKPLWWKQIALQKIIPLDQLRFAQTPAAVAGIGNPERFFSTLSRLSIPHHSQVFPDHHHFTESDFASIGDNVVMTEKDAVKCQKFAKPHWYSLIIGAQLGEEFWQAFQKKLISLQGH